MIVSLKIKRLQLMNGVNGQKSAQGCFLTPGNPTGLEAFQSTQCHRF